MVSQTFPHDRKCEHPLSSLGLTQHGHTQPGTTQSKDIVKVKRREQSPYLSAANTGGPQIPTCQSKGIEKLWETVSQDEMRVKMGQPRVWTLQLEAITKGLSGGLKPNVPQTRSMGHTTRC